MARNRSIAIARPAVARMFGDHGAHQKSRTISTPIIERARTECTPHHGHSHRLSSRGRCDTSQRCGRKVDANRTRVRRTSAETCDWFCVWHNGINGVGNEVVFEKVEMEVVGEVETEAVAVELCGLYSRFLKWIPRSCT